MLGLAGVTATHAPTLNASLDAIGRLANWDCSWFQLEATVQSHSTIWRLELSSTIASHVRNEIVDASSASMVSIGRVLLGAKFAPEQVCLARSVPGAPSAYADFFRCPVSYDRSVSSIAIDELLLRKSSKLQNATLFEQLSFAASALARASDSSIAMRCA